MLAPAKINLTLEVMGKRADGYHDLASVMQTIDLEDTLSFSPAEDITFSCDSGELQTPDNLVPRAAKMLRQEMGVVKGVSMRLTKRVPVSAGLGGGSSDAAATLKGLNLFWGLGLGEAELWPLACRLGSDVPFFLRGGTALMEGRGDRIRWLPPMCARWMVIAVPPHRVSNKTATLYGSLTSDGYTDGDATRRLADVICSGGGVDSALLFNVFEEMAFDTFPCLREYRDRILASGAESAHLSGTGPALYAMAEGRRQAEMMAGQLAKWGVHAYVVGTSRPDTVPGPLG